MKIKNIYIGGWFQRTMLQLSEIYDFLRTAESRLDLNKQKLKSLHKALAIGQVDYGISGEEFIRFTTAENISVKIFEDGLIVLNTKDTNQDTLMTDIDHLQEYYESRLSPALNYLFSLGAPVPKELANIKNVYPYFIALDRASDKEMSDLLNRTERQKYFEFENDKYNVVRGDKYYFINNKKSTDATIERYIEEQIFIREFKGQLHRYLNIHRIIWEDIDKVKDQVKVRGEDIVKFTTQLEGYAKSINLIDARIKQMSTYLPTREKIAKNDADLAEFLEISGYRYETLKDTLEYIKCLWDMTKNYVISAQKQFESIKSEITSKSIKSLTIVTSMSAGAAIIDLFTESQPKFQAFGFIYFFILAILGFLANKILGFISNHQKYEVSNDTYQKIK